MKIQEYNKKNKSYYHFEESDDFCDISKIKRAEELVNKKIKLNDDDSIQLKYIVKIESLRYNIAKNRISLEEYKNILQSIILSCVNECHRNPFISTKVHEIFYDELNKLYD